MRIRRSIIKYTLVFTALGEAAALAFVSSCIRKSVDRDNMAAWGTTLNVTLLVIGVPLFFLLLGGGVLWLHDRLKHTP